MRERFNLPLPNVAITAGWPSRKCRGRASRRAPGEIIVSEWKGDAVEKAFVSIHPERLKAGEQTALAVLFVVGNEVYGSRRNLGSLTLGVAMNKETGMLEFTGDEKGKHAKEVLKDVLHKLGALPKGFAEIPEPAARQKTRMLKYACGVCKTIVRSAGTGLSAMCLHAGSPFYGQPGTPFALAAPKGVGTEGAGLVEAVPPAAPAPKPMTERENLMAAVKHGAARIVHGGPGGRNFGEAV